MLFESQVFEKCGVEWETHTLCKRHAYSLCDAHGGAVKRAIRRIAVKGRLLENAEEIAIAINKKHVENDGFENAWAYAYTNIDRSIAASVWASLKEWPGLKKCCEFQYNVIKDGKPVPTSGVVRMALCSGSGRYEVHDMFKRPKGYGTFCTKCVYLTQDIVYHQSAKKECPHYHKRNVGKEKSTTPANLGGYSSSTQGTTGTANPLLRQYCRNSLYHRRVPRLLATQVFPK